MNANMAYCEELPGTSCVIVRAIGVDLIAPSSLLRLPVWLSPSGVPRRMPRVGERVDTYRDGETLYAMGVRC